MNNKYYAISAADSDNLYVFDTESGRDAWVNDTSDGDERHAVSTADALNMFGDGMLDETNLSVWDDEEMPEGCKVYERTQDYASGEGDYLKVTLSECDDDDDLDDIIVSLQEAMEDTEIVAKYISNKEPIDGVMEDDDTLTVEMVFDVEPWNIFETAQKIMDAIIFRYADIVCVYIEHTHYYIKHKGDITIRTEESRSITDML